LLNPDELALTFNCPHIGNDGWGCGAAAGSECDWQHDGVTARLAAHERFHAELIMQTSIEGTVEIPKEVIDRAVLDLVD
jgi:hypothetical protein